MFKELQFVPLWTAAAVPWALHKVTGAHFGVLESRRVTLLRAIGLLNIKEKKKKYILKL